MAGRVLELVRAAAGAGAEAAVSVERRALALTRFANSYIHQNLAEDATTIGLRLHAGGRTVTGSSSITSADGLADLVNRTVEAVRHAPADPGWPGLAPPAPLAGEPSFDEATAAAPADARAERVRGFVAAAGGLETAGYCRTGSWSGAFANSAGHTVSERTSEAAMDGIARRDGADGVARLASARLTDLSGAELGNRAAAKARAGVDPVELPPGRYQVVLEPAAVADLLAMLAAFGFSGRAQAEKRTFAELGAAQFDRSVTLDDDPFRPGSPGHAYDLDGTVRRRLTLVDAGVTSALPHDRRTAAQVGTDSTGHGVRFFGALDALPGNLRLVPADGDPAGQAPDLMVPAAAPLLAGVDRGLLVSDFWYTRVLDPKTLVVTGLTRNGVWLIEGGEITRPVQNLRFTQSYPQALGPGAVTGIGSVADLLPAGLLPAWPSVPPVHLASWQFTGGASG
ncbi:MAG: TldD/PmbA family protein [Micromonosporaceae bacterium]|nr:TldD/PmbA family protein [Micromonosporaceae bacterium]